jgi:hypothetical protein
LGCSPNAQNPHVLLQEDAEVQQQASVMANGDAGDSDIIF